MGRRFPVISQQDRIRKFEFFDHFDSFASASAAQHWISSNGGTPGSVSISPAQNNHRGMVSINTDVANVSTTGRLSLQQVGLNILLGNGAFDFAAYVQVVDLSTVAQEYSFQIGITDTLTPASIAHRITLVYDRLNFGANWQMIVEASSVRTTRDTGVAVVANAGAAGWQRVGFSVNAARTSVQAKVTTGEGTSLANVGAPVTTNIPAAAQALQPLAYILKSAGGTNRICRIDWCRIKYPMAA